MSSKRDKLKNAMSKNIFIYEQEASTPVEDMINSFPSELNLSLENDNLNIKDNKLDEQQKELITNNLNDKKIFDTENIISSTTNTTAESTETSKIERIENTEAAKEINDIAFSNTLMTQNIEPISQEVNEIVKNEKSQLQKINEPSIVKAEFLTLFKSGCNNIKNLKDLSSIKEYFLNENKTVTPISIRLDKELDVFSKIEAYKNKLTLNMYYNYIIFKDMQKNIDAENYNPVFDLNNDTLYRKTPAYNSVQKTFSVIPELKEYLSVYGAKLGVTSGNYFKYILRKEYEQSENSCIN